MSCFQLFLGKMYGDTNDTQNAIKTYTQILEIHEFHLSTNAEVLTPFLFKGVLELFQLYFRTSQMDKAWQLLKKLRESLVVTSTGDDRIFFEENRQIYASLGMFL
jgi:hypothetical protein